MSKPDPIILRRRIAIIVLILALCIIPAPMTAQNEASEAGGNQDSLISIKLHPVNAEYAISFIAYAAGVDFLISSRVEGVVSVGHRDAPWDEVLESIIENADIKAYKENDLLCIYPGDNQPGPVQEPLDFSSLELRDGASPESTIGIHLRMFEIKVILQDLNEVMGVNIVAYKGIHERVSIAIDRMMSEKLLYTLARMENLKIVQDGNVVKVVPPNNPLAGRIKSGKKYTGQPVNFHVKEVELTDAIALLEKITGQRLKPAARLKGQVSIDLDNVPADQLVEVFLESQALKAVNLKGVKYIFPLPVHEKKSRGSRKRIGADKPVVYFFSGREPVAEISIDGKMVGQTPFYLELSPGPHQVQAANYPSKEPAAVTGAPGMISTVYIPLEQQEPVDSDSDSQCTAYIGQWFLAGVIKGSNMDSAWLLNADGRHRIMWPGDWMYYYDELMGVGINDSDGETEIFANFQRKFPRNLESGRIANITLSTSGNHCQEKVSWTILGPEEETVSE
jgi:hypothetical protein